MQILNLRIKNYKRLSLSNISYLDYTPKKFIQLVLGQNGSGKSSLLLMLTPLPPDMNKDFDDEGFKEITILHNNSTYLLRSVKHKNNHYFIKDGKELNDGNTKRVQLKLVEEHFKLTPDIMEVLLGSKTFTNMSIGDRKNWLTKISDVDYNYSISLFIKLKSRLRDITGGLKILNSKLVELEKHDLTENEITSLKKEHNTIMSIINLLLESKHDVPVMDERQLSGQLDTLNRELGGLLNIASPLDNDELNVDKNKALIKKSIIDKEISNTLNMLEKVKEYELLKSDDITVIKKEMDDVETNIKKISNSVLIKFKDIDSSYNILNNQYTDISSILLELDSVKDVNHTVDNLHKITNRLNQIGDLLRIEDNLLSKNIATKESLEEAKQKEKVSCSKCGHSWLEKYDEKTYEMVLKNIAKSNDKIVSLKSANKDTNERLERVKIKRGLVDKFEYIMNSEALSPLLSKITSMHNVYDSPLFIKDELFKYLTMMETWAKLPELYKKLDTLSDKIDYVKKTNESMMDFNGKSKDSLEDELAILYDDLKKANEIISNVDKNILLNKKINIIFNKSKETLYAMKKSVTHEYKSLVNGYLNTLIIFYRDRNAEIEIKIREYEFTEKSLSNLKKEISDLDDRRRVLYLLVKELSPNEGLIAKSIMNFLKQFTINMNELISTVWSYDMEVLPCDISEKDLDYKFPVLVNNSTEIIDVSKTSSGMQEIINLAFKITSMYYLGIETYPLYLDEYGKSLSIEHRANAFNIHNTLANFNFNQIYIISHFNEQITKMNNGDTDTVILGDESVYANTIDSYNKVIQFIE